MSIVVHPTQGLAAFAAQVVMASVHAKFFPGFLIPLMLVDAAGADLVIAVAAHPVQPVILKLPSARATRCRCHADNPAHLPGENQSPPPRQPAFFSSEGCLS